MTIREDRSDTKRSLAQHAASGESWIVQHCSLWNDDDDCVGGRIIASVGPLDWRDILDADGPLTPSVALFDRIDSDEWELTDEDAEWLQDEEEAGRLTYPVGAR